MEEHSSRSFEFTKCMNQKASTLISLLQTEKDIFVRARYIERLRRDEEISIKEIGRSIGKDPSYVSHIVRLLKLPSIVIDGYYGKQISLTHLLIISRLKSQSKMQLSYKTVLEKNLNAIETENFVRRENYQVQKVGDRLSDDELNIIIRKILDSNPDVDVKIVQTRIKGKLYLEIKGDTEKTTKAIQELASKLSKDSIEDIRIKKDINSLAILD